MSIFLFYSVPLRRFFAGLLPLLAFLAYLVELFQSLKISFSFPDLPAASDVDESDEDMDSESSTLAAPSAIESNLQDTMELNLPHRCSSWH